MLPLLHRSSYSMAMKDVYRSAASVMVLRQASGDGFQFLLLHKPRKNDAWQLPQGGVEQGENVEQAALRELLEEAGITCTFLGESERVYQYDFPPRYRRFRPDNVCGQRICYVFALADPDAQVTVDNKEVDGFKWIDPSRIPAYVHRKEYVDIVKGLYEEAVSLVRNDKT